MLHAINAIEIMRLTDAVYECDTLTDGQNIDSFTEIKDTSLKKRYIKFENLDTHNKQSALKEHLEKIGNGDAVITKKISEQNGQFILSNKGFTSATFIDLSKVTDYDDRHILEEIVNNTLQKMQLSKLKKELSSTKAKANEMRNGIKKINETANKTKTGLGSRNVKALKNVITQITTNTK